MHHRKNGYVCLCVFSVTGRRNQLEKNVQGMVTFLDTRIKVEKVTEFEKNEREVKNLWHC